MSSSIRLTLELSVGVCLPGSLYQDFDLKGAVVVTAFRRLSIKDKAAGRAADVRANYFDGISTDDTALGIGHIYCTVYFLETFLSESAYV